MHEWWGVYNWNGYIFLPDPDQCRKLKCIGLTIKMFCILCVAGVLISLDVFPSPCTLVLCFYISLSVCKAWVGWATKAPRWPWMMMMQCLWMWGSLCQTWWRCFHTPLLTDNSLSENRGKAKRDRECMGKEDKSCEWRTKREQKGKKCSQLYRRRGDNILSFYFM